MLKILSVLLCVLGFSAAAHSQDAPAQDEWEQFRKTGLFQTKSPLWIAPDMTKESVQEFSSRLLEGAREGNANAMATLARIFHVRGDHTRASEWLAKAAETGHGGAFLDLGALCANGIGREQDLVEGYKWLWLATWEKAPGADASLIAISKKLSASQVIDGVQRASKFLDAHPKPKTKAAASAGR